MSFQPLSHTFSDTWTTLYEWDALPGEQPVPNPEPKVFELPPGPPAPAHLEGPITAGQAALALAEANEELNRLDNHALVQRQCLYDYVKVRVERYQLLKVAIATLLGRQPFDHQCQQQVLDGLHQFRQANWALRELLAHEPDEQLKDAFRDSFNWVRVAQFLKLHANRVQQAPLAGENPDAMLCRLECSSTLQSFLKVLEEIRASLEPQSHALRQSMAVPLPSPERLNSAAVAPQRAIQCSPDRKRALQGDSSAAGTSGSVNDQVRGPVSSPVSGPKNHSTDGPSDGGADNAAEPPIKRALAAKLGARRAATLSSNQPPQRSLPPRD